MNIHTKHFGVLRVDENTLLKFPRGLMGLPNHKSFVLVDSSTPVAHWLQATNDPDMTFLVAEAQMFFRDYHPPAREELLMELECD